MARKTRSDCTVGTFEKNMGYQQERLGVRRVEIQEVIKKLKQ